MKIGDKEVCRARKEKQRSTYFKSICPREKGEALGILAPTKRIIIYHLLQDKNKKKRDKDIGESIAHLPMLHGVAIHNHEKRKPGRQTFLFK